MGRMVEVDEDQLVSDRKLRGYVNALMANPKAKVRVQEAMKIVDPNAPTPELDQANAAAEPVLALQKKFDDFVTETKKEREDRERKEKLDLLDQKVNTGIAALKRDGWTQTGIDAVKKIMEDQGILDVEVAAAYYEKKNPPPAPMTPGGSGAWNFMDMPSEGADDLKKMIETRGDSELVINKMANDALNEVRGNARR